MRMPILKRYSGIGLDYEFFLNSSDDRVGREMEQQSYTQQGGSE